jgi:hypothetical protein
MQIACAESPTPQTRLQRPRSRSWLRPSLQGTPAAPSVEVCEHRGAGARATRAHTMRSGLMMDSAKPRTCRWPRVARWVALIVAVAALGCDQTATSGASRDVRLTSARRHGKSGRVPQQELQEDIQRFAGQLIERTGQATVEVMGPGKPDAISTEALRERRCLRSRCARYRDGATTRGRGAGHGRVRTPQSPSAR